MAVKRYNGTSWDTVAGLGAQGAAAQSSSITTWVKTATGGETSLTGSSDSSTTLAYTPGQEQFFINGVLQVRGSDYTATDGTSITGITALVAGDIATVTTVNAFSVTGAVPLSTVTANGDLIVGTSAGAVGRLGVGSTGQVLSVSGGSPSWVTVPGAYTLLASGNFSTSSATLAISSIPSTYKELYVVLRDVAPTTTPSQIQMRLNNDSTQLYGYTTTTPLRSLSLFDDSQIGITANRNVFNSSVNSLFVIRIPDYANTTAFKSLTNSYFMQEDATNFSGGFTSGFYRSTTAISQINFLNHTASNWASGSYELFGVN